MEPNTTPENWQPRRDDLYRAILPGAEIRDGADAGPAILVGHFSPFNQWAEINSRFEGHFLEKVEPGSFKKAFSDPFRSQIKVQFDHGEDFLGDQLLGLPTSLREDDYGAHYEVELFDGIPPLLMSGLRKGAYGSSYHFRVLRQAMERNPKRSDFNPEGIPERTIKEVEVYEFGPVTWPAFTGATAGIRSMTDRFYARKLARAPELRELLAPESITAPSTVDAADEPHLDKERSEPVVVAVPVQPRFHTREDFQEWLSSRI